MSVARDRLKLGIMPLMDAAPLVVAKERGFFAEQCLEVELCREASWANIRDKVAVGALDGAQMLAPMPLSMTLGLGAIRETVVTGLALNQGGNTITVSAALCHRLREKGGPLGAALKQVIEDDKKAGRPALAFAMVYPFSTHNYELRFWLAQAGIDPDRDVRLSVVPPPQMIGHLSAGNIAGFCVGEPWGSLAASMELGSIVATSDQLFAGRLEKVLGVTRSWADNHPDIHVGLIKAVLAAARWCDANGEETAALMAQPNYVNVPRDAARAALTGPQAPRFSHHCANFPWRSQALWYLSQMQRWGQLGPGADIRRVAEECYRPDLYRLAALDLGLAVPLIDYKTEGGHAAPWTLDKATAPIAMAPDLMAGGATFDPFALSPQPALPEQAEGLTQ